MHKITWKTLDSVTGGLSAPGKMPCKSWSIPAIACNVGSKLAKLIGSVCSECYALKGMYMFPSTRDAMARRLAAFHKDPEAWAKAMAASIEKTGNPHFRWFDSGDLQSEAMLSAIVEVAKATPKVKHWLPTKESKLVSRWLNKHGELPRNITLRVSAPMVDQEAPKASGGLRWFSTVFTDKPLGRRCPAPDQDGECRDCRACWDKRIPVISYHHH